MIWRALLILSFILISWSCARIVMPPGGPEDNTPPQIQKSEPQNFSTQFYSDKISINFDEYIVLKNFNSEFVASPLFPEKPKKILKGKSLILKFDKDSLRPNTTYTLDFGNSIVDYRKGNVLKGFQYVFSTGQVVDSLHISGHLYSAKDLKPEESIWILLYKTISDSTLRTQQPDFIAKTDASGAFSINNIAAGTYGIAALKDINNNYIFDLPNEQIAFLDSTFHLSLDTQNLAQDSLMLSKQDSSSISDTTQARTVNVKPKAIDLYLFEEDFSNQYLSAFKRTQSNVLSLIFNQPYDSLLTISIDKASKQQWLLEANLNKDTFNIWLLDTALAHRDSIKMRLNYYQTDSTGNLVMQQDTLDFNIKFKPLSKPKKSKKKQDSSKLTKNILSLKGNFMGSPNFDFYKTLSIVSSFPLDSVNPSFIQFYEKKDTIFIPQSIIVTKDSLKPRQYDIGYALEEDKTYKIDILPGAFVDYRNYTNDSIEQIFKTTKLSKYTEIQLKVTGVKGSPVIIQLLKSSGDLLEQRAITKDTTLIFTHLNPEKYKLKMIEDANNNGLWDTGNYDLKQQPERILFYPDEIPTKPNWAHEIVWDLNISKP